MSEQTNVQLIKQCYDAFLSGDAQLLLKYMAKDIDWQLPEVEGIAFSGRRHGRDAVAQFFQTVGQLQELREFRPKEFTAQDDRVVATGHYEWTVKATRAEFGADWCHVFRVLNGEIVEFSEYTDTLRAALAYQAPASAALQGAARPGAGMPAAH